MEWNERNTVDEEVIGCVIDVVSNIVAFTRNGRPDGAPLYLGSNILSCDHDTHPTINVKPECDPAIDLELPSLKIRTNYGATSFQYQEDVKSLLLVQPSVKPIVVER